MSIKKTSMLVAAASVLAVMAAVPALSFASPASSAVPGIQEAAGPTGPRYPLVPMPQKLEPREGEFTFARNATVYADSRAADIAIVLDFLRERFGKPTGIAFNEAARDAAPLRLIRDASAGKADGAYILDITPKVIEIRAANGRGFFYGLQTLRQLLPPAIESRTRVAGVEWRVPCVHIADSPRFVYRGLHLDVCRHFFPVAFVKKYIDLIALQKMDFFHWHLTDDQGWRIEIKEFPRLTRVGSIRARTLIGHGAREPFIYDNEPYGGFYTQKEIREVVAYARSRFVTIVPEVEMPGHALAALASYPDLGCTGGPYKVAERWGVFPEVFCAGNDRTFKFMEKVLDEVCALFPGPYIHIGGDECPKDSWKVCPKCQARIKAEGLKDENELQSYFVKRMEKYLQKKNRRIIGWDEILEGGLAPQATVMSWRGTQGGTEAARQKHDVIMTPGSFCYLDYYQADPATEPLAIGGFVPLKKVYSYEPVPPELSPEEQAHILGPQGNLWTEYIGTTRYAEYMAYPRACAMAEVGWTLPENKDWRGFLGRLEGFYKHLEALDVNYFRGNRGALVE